MPDDSTADTQFAKSPDLQEVSVYQQLLDLMVQAIFRTGALEVPEDADLQRLRKDIDWVIQEREIEIC